MAASNGTSESETDPAPRDRLAELLNHDDAQAAALVPVWRPAYEYSMPFSFGGPQSTFTVYRQPNPWSSPAEWCIVSIASSAAATGTLQLTDQMVLPATKPTYDPTGAGGRGVVQLVTAGAVTVPFGENWFPLPSGGTLSLSVVVAGTDVLVVTVQFRRRIQASGVYAVAEN